MNERVLILRDAVVKITQMLTGRGITVTQRGISAYVKADADGKPVQVNLPFLPDNATEELCAAIQGFLDHEVAHILFSDFKVVKKATSSELHGMLNMLEDARIESEMARKFSGCAHNLSVTGKFFLDKYIVPEFNKAMAAADNKMAINTLMVPLIRAMAGQFIFKEFMRDKMRIVEPVFEKIKDLEERIQNAKSTADCLDIASEMHKRLIPPSPPASGSSSGSGTATMKGKASAGAGGSGKGEKGEDEGKGKGKGKAAKAPKPAPEPEEEEDEAGAATGEEEKSPAPGEEEGSAPTSTPEEPEEEEDEAGAAPAPAAPGEEEEGAGPGEEEDDEEDLGGGGGEGSEGDFETIPDERDIMHESQAIWDAINKEQANNYDKTMSSLITGEAVDAAKGAQYLVFTKEGDTIEPLRVGREYDSSMLRSLSDQVDHMVGPLQKDLERAIAARSLATWEAGRRSGRLHSANLSRLAVGDDRVFRRRHETTSKDVAVELVIDASGSMSGSKIHLATQSAYALSQVLERIGIAHEVICFTTGAPCVSRSEVDAEARKIGRGFSRFETLYMPVLKSFSERLKTDIKERFAWLPNSRILRNNVDGECVEIAGRRLMQRRETGKVMIVLSDGMPSADGDTHAFRDHLKKTVANIAKSGVKVIGIGIQSNAVQSFYPKNLVINNVSELPDRVIKELRHLLISN